MHGNVFERGVLYLDLEVPLKVHVSVGICPVLKGQCLHALYVSSVHVSDQHQNKYKYELVLARRDYRCTDYHISGNGEIPGG
jgi:hypothetical protein